MTWPEAIAAIEAMRALEPDFAGDGTMPPGDETINTALREIGQSVKYDVDPPDRVIVSTNGGIILEWFTEDGIKQHEWERNHTP